MKQSSEQRENYDRGEKGRVNLWGKKKKADLLGKKHVGRAMRKGKEKSPLRKERREREGAKKSWSISAQIGESWDA